MPTTGALTRALTRTTAVLGAGRATPQVKFSTCPGAPSRSGSSPPPWNCICILHGIGIGHQLQHLGGVCDWSHLAIGAGAGRLCCCCPVPVHACLLWSVGLAV
jgi:hypothetical protein